MRNFVLLISGLLVFNFIFSQQKAQKNFLERSKKQKRTAWILLGTGTAAVITGAIIDNSVKRERQSFTGGFIEVGGIICALTSIPFFISSSKNKKRATTLTIHNQTILLPRNNSFVSRDQPSLSLHIPLNQ